MEVRDLFLAIDQDRLTGLISRYLPAEAGISDLAVVFFPGKASVSGRIKKMIASVRFESLWTIAVVDGKVRIHLEAVKGAMGIGHLFRGQILKKLTEKLAHQPWFKQERDVLWIDVERMLVAREIPLMVRLRRITCTNGELHIEAGTRTSSDET